MGKVKFEKGWTMANVGKVADNHENIQTLPFQTKEEKAITGPDEKLFPFYDSTFIIANTIDCIVPSCGDGSIPDNPINGH